MVWRLVRGKANLDVESREVRFATFFYVLQPQSTIFNQSSSWVLRPDGGSAEMPPPPFAPELTYLGSMAYSFSYSSENNPRARVRVCGGGGAPKGKGKK